MSESLNPDFLCIKERMSEKRFHHTLGVRECALSLGRILLPDAAREIEAAAMLHDIAKELPASELIAAIEQSDWQPVPQELSAESLLHAYAAPFYIKRDFPRYATEPILRAVYYHTVGRADMTVLEKIVFLADFIEKGRSYSACREVREWFYRELSSGDDPMRVLDRAVLRVLDFTIEYLIREGLYISPMSLQARNSILTEISRH